MGKLIVTEFITLDGIIDDPGGSEDIRTGAGASASPPRKDSSSSSRSWSRPTCS
jgi:hypothetical protein